MNTQTHGSLAVPDHYQMMALNTSPQTVNNVPMFNVINRRFNNACGLNVLYSW